MAIENYTPTTRRTPTPHPKPQGALDAEYARQGGQPLTSYMTPLERLVLRHIADNADLVELPGHMGAWLLVQLPAAMFSALCDFESDLGEDDDKSDYEADSDGEVTHPDHVSQSGLAQACRLPDDAEECEPAEDDGTTEPNLGWEHWVPDWKPWLALGSDWQQADGDD